MKKIVTIIVLALVAATIVIMTSRATTTASQNGPAIVLSPKIPGDAQFGSLPPNATNEQKLLAIQGDFDIYSWNTFIALNWPPVPRWHRRSEQDDWPERRQRHGVGTLPQRLGYLPARRQQANIHRTDDCADAMQGQLQTGNEDRQSGRKNTDSVD